MKAVGIFLSGALLASAGPLWAARADDPRPNIILILADDLGYGNLGCYGQALIQTPELDTLAAQGLRLTRFYSAAALCLPSRVSLMTGLHLGHSRVRENGGSGLHEPLQEEDTSLATVIKAAGYRTAMIGKWALGDAFLGNTVTSLDYDGPGALYKHGWDFYLGEPNQTYNHDYYPDHIYRYDPGGILGAATADGRLTPYPLADDPGTPDFVESYTTDVYFKEALAFVDAAREEPFFLYLALQTPHKDFVVPALEPYAAGQSWTTNEKRFASMISRMDRMIGDLVDRLAVHGIEEETLVIFTSDNGGLPDFDSRFDNNGPLSGFKGEASEGGLRVPCIAWWPGRVAAGRESTEILYFPDFLPTFAALAGIEAPSPTDGISFIPTLLDAGTQPARDYLFFLAGTDGVAPALQDYHVVKGPGETRTDAAIRDAALSPEVTVPAFSRRRTALMPAVLYPPEGPFPLPATRFLTDDDSGALRLEVEVPDGVAYSVQTSPDLILWNSADQHLRLAALRGGAVGGQLAYFELLQPLADRLFTRLEVAAYAGPQPVAENPSTLLLLATDFTAHEIPGSPPNDSAPAWQRHAVIADPGAVQVAETSGPVSPAFFPGFADELAVDLNVTTESRWKLDIPVVASAALSLDQLRFTARHYSNDGTLKDFLENSFYTAAVLDGSGSVLETRTIEAPQSGSTYAVSFSTLAGLPAAAYTLRIVAEANGDGRGNNQGLDDLRLEGRVD